MVLEEVILTYLVQDSSNCVQHPSNLPFSRELERKHFYSSHFFKDSGESVFPPTVFITLSHLVTYSMCVPLETRVCEREKRQSKYDFLI